MREGDSRVGGGAFPEADLPTFMVCATHKSIASDALQRALLRGNPPVLARVEQDCLCFDPRTLQDGEFAETAAGLRKVLASLA